MPQKSKLFFVLFCFAFFIFLCEAQEKKPKGTVVAPKPAPPQEEQIEVDGMLLTKDGKTLIKPKSPWLHTVTIPDQVRIIRGGAFRSNHRLQSGILLSLPKAQLQMHLKQKIPTSQAL